MVRAYYAATRTEHPADALAPLVADDAVLAAPSLKMLKGVPQVEGKDAFVEAVDGGSFLIGKATVRDVFVRNPNLVIRRASPRSTPAAARRCRAGSRWPTTSRARRW